VSRIARAVATVGGLGDRLPAPGTTAGSFPAAVVWWGAAAALGGTWWLWAVTLAMVVLATVVGVWSAGSESRRRGREDPGAVVIDEVAGQWLTYLCAVGFWARSSTAELALFVLSGFFLFRVFDVLKPWPVRRLERLPGGVGVVADDLAAACLAGLVLALARPLLLAALGR
jgi:phosphatidylglycerophosphatase A